MVYLLIILITLPLYLQNTWKCTICGTKGAGPKRGLKHFTECATAEKEKNIATVRGFMGQLEKKREEMREIDQAFTKWAESKKFAEPRNPNNNLSD